MRNVLAITFIAVLCVAVGYISIGIRGIVGTHPPDVGEVWKYTPEDPFSTAERYEITILAREGRYVQYISDDGYTNSTVSRAITWSFTKVE